MSKREFGDGWRATAIEHAISYAANHPVRLDCLAILIDRDASAKIISAELKMDNIPAIARHLEGMYKDGTIELVESKTGGPRRAATEKFYRACALPKVTEEDWLKMPDDGRRRMAGCVLQAVVALSLSALRCQTMEQDDNLNIGWQVVPVDEEGEGELVDLLVEFGERVDELKARNAARLDESGEQGTPRVVSRLSFVQADPTTWKGRQKGFS